MNKYFLHLNVFLSILTSNEILQIIFFLNSAHRISLIISILIIPCFLIMCRYIVGLLRCGCRLVLL